MDRKGLAERKKVSRSWTQIVNCERKKSFSPPVLVVTVHGMQAAFTRCWEAGPYPELLRYNDAPPGDLSAEQTAWCRKRLVDVKLIEP